MKNKFRMIRISNIKTIDKPKTSLLEEALINSFYFIFANHFMSFAHATFLHVD